jgi:uncharacterized phage infection (PIP) family protein YhgE
MYADAKAVNKHRLTERDTLIAALNSATAAQQESAEASKERNKLTQDLARIINELTQQNETGAAVSKLQFDHLKDDFARMDIVINAMAESIRNLASMNTDLKTFVLALSPLMQSLQNILDNIRSANK